MELRVQSEREKQPLITQISTITTDINAMKGRYIELRNHELKGLKVWHWADEWG